MAGQFLARPVGFLGEEVAILSIYLFYIDIFFDLFSVTPTTTPKHLGLPSLNFAFQPEDGVADQLP